MSKDDLAAAINLMQQAVTKAQAALQSWPDQTTPEEPTEPTDPEPPSSGRPFFAKADWLWSKIPSSPVLDPKSSQVAGELAQGQTKLAIIDFGVTIRTAKPTDPKVTVKFSQNWGDNPHGGKQMPIPGGNIPIPPGGYGAVDGHVVVIDPQQKLVFSEWMARDSGRSAGWGSAVDINGDATEPGSMTSTGSKISRLAGVITEAEMAAGVIPHALFMSCKLVGGGFRYPALKTDQSGGEATQEGMRIQLDPAFDISTLKSKPARIVAKAMQDYGIVVGDGGGAGATIICEYPGSSLSSAYKNAGVTGDYMQLDIPWSRCRVLKNWHGK